MPYEGAFQTTILGRFIRFASRDKLLKYPDEIELPEQFRPATDVGVGDKAERWRSPSNADNRWRGSSRMKIPQNKVGKILALVRVPVDLDRMGALIDRRRMTQS
jgi:hypothetical protein